MKTQCIIKNSFTSFCLMAFMTFILFIGCQQDELNELTTKGLDSSPEDQITSRSSESLLTLGNANDDFGMSVASIGNKAYVSARNLQKVYEYAKTGGTYTLINEITPNPATLLFGTAFSVSGNWMAVGAPISNSSANGRVFMYKKQGNTWQQKAILSGPATNVNFGGLRCVALQGNTLAVTSIIPGSPVVSTISVFTLSGNEWTLQQEIVTPGIRHNALKLDASENRIATAGVLNNFGTLPRALVYLRNGSTWTLEDEVIINLPGVTGTFDVAIEGNTIVLPANLLPGNRHFVITNNGGNWEVSQELLTPPGQGNKFVAIEGQKIIIGVSASNNAFSDQVHVFENFGTTWDYIETLTPVDLGINVRIMSVALEGNTILAGSPGNSGFAGKVYVFE